ncbi:hypothetical protein [Lacinutrix sp. Bg11-31]|uniref:hypothetical protein n=1 Tax=Lacinutrix sp. Bg11-31 TaxID=2057808 RepID=UPI000C305CEE|nr:hypothetical protein [Lacinutrix sp. Bg11-31]AUC81159.1 hypothetical protein CW733_03030 [Lacinutrix sp. Bg11-31]
MNKLITTAFLIIIFCSSCSSSRLVNEYKNPETYTFEANKVLVIGMTADKELRRGFEKKIAKALEKNNIIGVKSVDFFETSFTNRKQTIEELNALESQLLEAGFDAILLTKVTGQETKVALISIYDALETGQHKTFDNYYYGNQKLFFKQEPEHYVIYFTETTLYCICPGKERELLWQGNIEVTKSPKSKRNIKDYTKTLLKSLKDNNLLIVQ